MHETISTASPEESSAPEDAEKYPATITTSPASNINNKSTNLGPQAIQPPKFRPTREFNLAFLSLCSIIAAVAFEATSLSVALPLISTELGGTALQAFWTGTGYLLSGTVLKPIFASLSGIFGRKYVICLTGILFAGGSLVGGLARSFDVLLVGRVIQGAGGGGLVSLGEIVVTDLVPLAYRGQWLSIFSAIWAIGTVSGPLIGAGFAQNVTWRWIFYINLPITIIGLFLISLFLHQEALPGGIAHKLRQFDYTGSLLFIASMTAFLYGLTTGGVVYGWSEYQVLLPLLLGLVGVVIFAGYEWWLTRSNERGDSTQPVIHGDKLFGNWTAVAAYIMTIFHGAVLWSIIYFLLLYYQGVKFYTPVISAVAGLPESLTVTPAAVVVGVVAGKTGRYRWALWGGWFLATLGAGLLLLLQPETTVAQWIFLNIPLGIGTGMLFPAMGLCIQASSEPEHNAEAVAFFAFMSSVGQAIGVAVSGVIFQNALRQKLQALPAFAALAEEYSRDATILVGIINEQKNHMGSGEEDHIKLDQLVRAYNNSLHMIWVALLAFSAASLILSLTVKGYSLSQEHVTKQGLVRKENVNDKKETPQDNA